MSSVIDFLEKIGSDATLRDASPEEMELAMEEVQIEAPLRSAILNQDTSALQALLRQVPLFIIQIPHEDEPEEEEEEGDEEDEDAEGPTPKGTRSTFKRIVAEGSY